VALVSYIATERNYCIGFMAVYCAVTCRIFWHTAASKLTEWASKDKFLDLAKYMNT
jgi:hypothetical protein